VSGKATSERAGADLPAELIAAALTGDPDAVSRLFSQIRPALVRYCRARITPRSGHGGADDVAQDICVAVLRGLPTFAGRPDEIRSWVYGIAAHKIIDYYRRSGRDMSDPAEHPPNWADPRAGPEELAIHGERRAVVQALLAKLNPVQREILTLRIIVGLSSADTAAVTGMTATAVRVTQHRALNRIRSWLQSSGAPGADA
jgi:RNA polymerase sigma-70 factor (ECF subfamily)